MMFHHDHQRVVLLQHSRVRRVRLSLGLQSVFIIVNVAAWSPSRVSIVNVLFMAPRMVYCSIINLLWSLMSKMSTMFQSVSYRLCSRSKHRTHVRH